MNRDQEQAEEFAKRLSGNKAANERQRSDKVRASKKPNKS